MRLFLDVERGVFGDGGVCEGLCGVRVVRRHDVPVELVLMGGVVLGGAQVSLGVYDEFGEALAYQEGVAGEDGVVRMVVDFDTVEAREAAGRFEGGVCEGLLVVLVEPAEPVGGGAYHSRSLHVFLEEGLIGDGHLPGSVRPEWVAMYDEVVEARAEVSEAAQRAEKAAGDAAGAVSGHVMDAVVHVSAAERAAWNGKVDLETVNRFLVGSDHVLMGKNVFGGPAIECQHGIDLWGALRLEVDGDVVGRLDCSADSGMRRVRLGCDSQGAAVLDLGHSGGSLSVQDGRVGVTVSASGVYLNGGAQVYNGLLKCDEARVGCVEAGWQLASVSGDLTVGSDVEVGGQLLVVDSTVLGLTQVSWLSVRGGAVFGRSDVAAVVAEGRSNQVLEVYPNSGTGEARAHIYCPAANKGGGPLSEDDMLLTRGEVVELVEGLLASRGIE